MHVRMNVNDMNDNLPYRTPRMRKYGPHMHAKKTTEIRLGQWIEHSNPKSAGGECHVQTEAYPSLALQLRPQEK